MPARHTEKAFETAIELHLTKSGGYARGDNDAYDAKRALFPAEVLAFIKKTQPDEWKQLADQQKGEAEKTLLDDLCRALDSEHEGCLSVLRHGFKCYGALFRAAYFAPASGLNPETKKLYGANRLTITRQLRYSHKHGNTLDVTLALNGIPVATLELKNPMTGQTWRDAVAQYKEDRDATDLIFQFKKRALVHFAVDTDEAHMCTRIRGRKSVFLPFNRGRNFGAGNPEERGEYKTAYLWKTVLERDSFMDILARFVHLQTEKKKLDAKTVTRETMIFPRYHQLDCVRSIVADAPKRGAGASYLVQHSAGSGKSNSIAWLAHRLMSLHDKNDEKVFDSVVVVTDRVVLDQQLQDTIYQFEHTQGVVEKIDSNSEQLANALKAAKPIIVTTLQKFPFVSEKIGRLPERKYAVLIDEAHSSQSGETAKGMREVLGAHAVRDQGGDYHDGREANDRQEAILEAMRARAAAQPNISFFAFTATPKHKTLAVFGGAGNGAKPRPFHLYSMRQAIEEGFILDVLAHYTTYKTYYKLVKSAAEDPGVKKREAARALARFVRMHPYNIAQKTEVMVEHFYNFTRHKIGGKAKAMVVTGSRLDAVRYKQEFDRYIAEKKYTGIKTLVAFSGGVEDPKAPGVKYTESEMNDGISERELPERFAGGEYQVLLVAEKYQTGFDQPLLHTMYVDKRLSGIQAVQTLSRLNRTHPGKEDTFVLDFVNDPDEIRDAFQPYYEESQIGETAEPRQLYALQADLNARQIYHLQEVEEFCAVFYSRKSAPDDHSRMNACVDPAVRRYGELDDEEARADFRGKLVAYRNLYAFLSQVIPFQDPDLEKLYSYIRFLLAKLPRGGRGPVYNFDDDVTLRYYRLQKISEGALQLRQGEESPLPGPTEVGTAAEHAGEIELSRLIDILNRRFGTEFKSGDELFFESIREDALDDEKLREAAMANSMENFGLVFGEALEELFVSRMEQNEEITGKYLNEEEFRAAIKEYLLKKVYERFHADARAQ
ncbi:MAG: type I restriction endonuclease [Gammaproteobacteria bacterium]|nr:type I restriction endonuclease [Gammaproteobacteria bacterium]MDA7970522.1 type I restriction endonuclease [Gammaproteobacteria bacterium]MDA7994790.1 type I restriction endonuclease [Gammaproteobacteria bacterium]CAJ2376375.1 MAG: Type I restriction-modification system, restriction subunit R [Arenicellales bacterium IbO2]